MRLLSGSSALAVVLALAATAGASAFTRLAPARPSSSPSSSPSWVVTATGSDARLRGLAAVSGQVAWAGGSAGTVLRTVDGGRTWQRVAPPDTAEAEFRDIEAFDASHAVLLATGPGEASRVYVTADGGRSWTETFRNTDPAAFYDCLAFFDRRHGLALSDPVDGAFRVLATADGGRTWRVRTGAGMPAALDGEFAFAASGTCLVTAGHGGDAWFATGGGATARVFRTRDGGRRWDAVPTPVPGGPSAGIYSLAFRDPRQAVAVGGDFTIPDTAPDSAATSSDGGRTWTVSARVPGAYRSGAAWVSRGRPTVLAVGPTGSDVSRDGGRTWTGFDTASFDTVDCTDHGACWASGEHGRIGRLEWR